MLTPVSLDRLSSIALTGRILGTLFYNAPDSDVSAPLLAMLASNDWIAEWPQPSAPLTEIATELQEGLANPQQLKAAWQRLFIGPYALPAPPWGSVWLDKESVLFGDSTLALRHWMREHNIALDNARNEPEDHIGALLLLAAWLAEAGDTQALNELLSWHLLPWAPHFLTHFNQQAANPFYHAIGQLTLATLQHWQQENPIPIADKPLYR